MDHLAPDTAWDDAFEALLPLALPTARALDRVQFQVDEDRRLTAPLREGLNPSIRAATSGILRFGHITMYWDEELRVVPRLIKVSTPRQELQNQYFWCLTDRYLLRVKHEPETTADPGSRRLWNLEAATGLVEVFLCWDTNPDYTISNARFATLEEPKWSIPLALLTAQMQEVFVAPMPARPGVAVRSKLTEDQRTTDEQ